MHSHLGNMDGLMDCLTEDEQQKLAQIMDKLEKQLRTKMEEEDEQNPQYGKHHDMRRGMAGFGWGAMAMHEDYHMIRHSCEEEIPDIIWYEDYEQNDSCDGQ